MLVGWHSDGVRVATATATTTSARSLCLSVMPSTVNASSTIRVLINEYPSFFLSFFLSPYAYGRYERVQRGDHVRNWWSRFFHPGGRAGRFIRHHIDLYRFLHNGHPLSRLRSQGNTRRVLLFVNIDGPCE